MMRLGKRGSSVLCLAVAILSASAASARTERLRWTHAGVPAADSFKLYWGTSSGSYSSTLSVGVPAKDSTGAYYYDVVVPDTTTIYVTVSAWSGGLESVKSNQITRAGITGGTPSPPPPTSSTTKPNAPTVTASGWTVSVTPATTGAAHTSGWIRLYPFNSSGSPVTFVDPVSGGTFPRSLDLNSYFAQVLSTTRIEVEACAENAYGHTCAARLNVLRTSGPGPSSPIGAPGQPYIVQ